MHYGNIQDNYKGLISAVIWRSLEDIETSLYTVTARQRDEAMAFILSPDCESLCLSLGVSWERVKEKAAALYRKHIAKAG
jgi:hypothetical protein